MTPSEPDSPEQDVYRTLDLALRIGEMLLSNGAGAADVAATMLAVTNACGLRGVTPNVTFTELALNYHPPTEGFSILQTRSVTRRDIDYGDLTAVDALVRDLLAGRTDRDAARRRVAPARSSHRASGSPRGSGHRPRRRPAAPMRAVTVIEAGRGGRRPAGRRPSRPRCRTEP